MTISDIVNLFLYSILCAVGVPSLIVLGYVGVAMIWLLNEMLRGMSQ